MKFSDFMKKIGGSKKKAVVTDYAIAVFNNMTPGFIDSLREVVLTEESLRLYFSSMSFVIIFKSNKTIGEIENVLCRTFENDGSAYLLTPLKETKLFVVGSHNAFMDLNDGNPLKVNITTLKSFFIVLDNLKNQILGELPDDESGPPIIIDAEDHNFSVKIFSGKDETTSETDTVDEILDKINKTGIDSLNQKELEILNKISNKNGKKK